MTNEEFKNALIERHGRYIYEKLISSKAAIAGLGGLGSNVAISLARAGIGKLFLVDFDTVDITNLNRQQYFTEDIGRKKTEALSDIIKKINPVIKLETADTYVTEENALSLFKDYPIVCECFVKAENKAMLINTLLGQSDDITVVSASGMAGYGSSNTITTSHPMERLYLCGDKISGIEQGMGLMAPRVALCAMHQANTVLEIILENKGDK
mgnify:FL=1